MTHSTLTSARNALACALLGATLGAPLAAAAAPACVDPGAYALAARGIGGTGTPLAGVGGTGAPGSGVGGTGAPAAGVGGTGAMAAGVGGTGAPAGGIGGTGATADSGMGGTGIVGTITGFASICVNGLEIHYDEATPMSENGQTANMRRLAVGQVVAIDAVPSARGLEARRVVIMHALAGPVTHSDRQQLAVMGQPVRFASADVQADARALPAGAQVRVSGLRDADGTVVASRVERADDLGEHSAIGEVHREALDGLVVRGRPLPAAGTEALVRGRWSGRDLVARAVEANPGRPFADRADRLVIEARIRVDDGRRRVGGFELRGDQAAELESLRAGALVRVSGRREDGDRLRIERIERAREDARDMQDGRRGRGGDDAQRSEDAADDRSRDRERSDSDAREDRSGKDGGERRDERSGSNSGRDSRIDRDLRDRNDRIERGERSGRDDRPERPEADRSGRG